MLLHGAGVSAWMWEDVVGRLRPLACLTPDLPGHGTRWAEPFSFTAAVEAVADLVRRESPSGAAHVVGLSLGAQVALRLLADHQELVAGAVVSGALTRRIPLLARAWLVRPVVSAYLPFRDLPVLVRWNMRALEVPSRYTDRFAADTRRLTAASLAAVMAANATFDLPSVLSRCDTPILVLVGERERRVMHVSAGETTTRLPRAQGFVVSGAGHNWPLTHPRLFADTVRAWTSGGALPTDLLPLVPT